MAIAAPKTFQFKAGFGEPEVVAMREGVAGLLQEAGVAGASSYAFINLLDEFCCNMMEHAHANWVEISVEPSASSISATLRDDGVEFDPCIAVQEFDPDHPSNVTDRRLGLYLISLMAKDLRYRRENGINQVAFSVKQ